LKIQGRDGESINLIRRAESGRREKA